MGADPNGFMTCGSSCHSNSNCTSYLGNPCTFCDRGVCSPMCGVGCGSSADCAGGGNPCTLVINFVQKKGKKQKFIHLNLVFK